MLGAFLRPKGRRPRLTYWRAAALIPLFAILALVLVTFGLRVVLARWAGLHVGTVSYSAYAISFAGVAAAIFFLSLWSGLAVAIQRLHDRDRSGWWVLIALVPVVGSLWYLFWNGLRPGTVGSNRFGPDPLTPHEGIVEIFGDGLGPSPQRKRRKPVVSTIVAWLLLLAIIGLDALALFQNPGRQMPRPTAMPTEPIRR